MERRHDEDTRKEMAVLCKTGELQKIRTCAYKQEYNAATKALRLHVNGKLSWGQQQLRMRDVARRETEVAEDEKEDTMAEDDPSGHSKKVHL